MSWNIFNTVKFPRVPFSTFDLSHEYKGSGNIFQLIPVFCQPVLPGDRWRMNSEVFLRFAPMYAPIMHRVNVYCHYYFVPNRLVWDDWETFITGGDDGKQTAVLPYMPMTKSVYDSYPLLDYLGYNNVTADSTVQNITSLPMRGYQLIYNEYYRAQDIEAEITVPKTSGSDVANLANLCTLRMRPWEKDYFTAALKDPQRGPEVTIPNSASGLTVGLDPDTTSAAHFLLAEDHTNPSNGYLTNTNTGDAREFASNAQGSKPVVYDPNGTLKIGGSINNSTIEELRKAYRLQEFFEKSNVGGNRYKEMIYNHFGVHSSDARLDRPEYLGGFQAPVVVSEVLQKSATTEDSAQGTMAGHGLVVTSGKGFRGFRAEEHGYLFCIMSVLPRSTYQQGVARDWTKFDRLDFGWPEFAHLGEQEVYKQELYNDASDGKNAETFGYVPRYAEYKFIPSTVHGTLKNSLNMWHLGRIFSQRPNLNADFVHGQVNETTRIFNVTDETTEHLYFEILHNVRAKRPLPKYGTPMM